MNPALVAHIAGGAVGLAAGAVALAAPKGRGAHRWSGRLFTAAMLAMAAGALALSLTLPDWANLPGALFAAYLVVTGWASLLPAPRAAALLTQAAWPSAGRRRRPAPCSWPSRPGPTPRTW